MDLLERSAVSMSCCGSVERATFEALQAKEWQAGRWKCKTLLWLSVLEGEAG